MNQLSLIGHLTRDPQLRMLSDGRAVCDLRLAVNGGRDARPLFIDVATFGPQAEACARHLTKGREVAFTGRLSYSERESGDGSKRSKHSAIGRVEFRGRPSVPEQDTKTAASAATRRRRSRRTAD